MDFWRRLQTGFGVAVASSSPDLLLGVRDGFRRYFHQGLGTKVPIALSGHKVEQPASGLPLGDNKTVALARSHVRELENLLGLQFQFYVSSHGGVESLEVSGRFSYLLRSWTVISSPLGEAWGSSGSIELPLELFEQKSEAVRPTSWVIGTRRQGGLTAALTAGLETRREATALSSFHALSGLCHGILQSRPQAGPRFRLGV